jgi:hypothetical protein
MTDGRTPKPISSNRLLGSLKQAAGWPGSDRNTVVTLALSLVEARAHLALAVEILAPVLLAHPDSSELAELRKAVLIRLMEQRQLLDPFGFVVYAQLTGAELSPVG